MGLETEGLESFGLGWPGEAGGGAPGFGERLEEKGDDGGDGGFMIGGPDAGFDVGGFGNGDGDIFHEALFHLSSLARSGFSCGFLYVAPGMGNFVQKIVVSFRW